jgi:hypothetical protein
MTTEQILKQIEELSQDTMLATNAGTFGADECCRAVGTGGPRFGTWHTYERLDGTRYSDGADQATAPGYARHLTPISAVARRAQIASLKRNALKEQLARGWCGYQFIGIEEGQRRLTAMS